MDGPKVTPHKMGLLLGHAGLVVVDVGSHQVPFPMCTLETLQNIAAQVLYS